MRRATKRKAVSSDSDHAPAGPRYIASFTTGPRGTRHTLTPTVSQGKPAPSRRKRRNLRTTQRTPNSDSDEEKEPQDEHRHEPHPDAPAYTVNISKVLAGTKSPNDYMRDWLNVSRTYLNVILDAEAPPDACTACGDSGVDYRCLDCSACSYLCWECCSERHAEHPLHRIEAWNNVHFEPSWLWTLGSAIFLGHNGSPCPAHPIWTYPQSRPDLPPLDDITYGASPGKRKLQDCPVLVVVHTNGIHHLPFVPCKCSGCEPLDVQLLRAGYFPATQDSPRTVFSFQLLDLYAIETLECHTATNSFYSKLRRLTNKSFPESVPDRYRELLRTGRQWRHLVELTEFGFANHGGIPGEGDLALFCPACPQPGVNLPEDWEDDPDQWAYGITIVLDGNFVCIHRLLRSRDGDWIWLKGKGEGYLTAKDPYQRHVNTTSEVKEVSKCYNHRAIADRGKSYKGCDVSGIGAAACGRHGAFIPTSVVNFQKGERQLNMDYVLSKAFEFGTLQEAPRIICLYDIGRQYPVNAPARMAASDALMDPALLEKVIWGIGTWHVHGHKEECLARYSPTFIQGAGTMTGEILESLWSTTNDVGKTSSIMSLPARSEALDAVMLNNNRKKMRRLIPALEKSLLTSRMEWDEAEEDFLSLSTSASAESRNAWTQIMEKAEAERSRNVKAMDVYNVNLRKPPSRKAVQARLMSDEQDRGGNTVGITKWVMLGIDIQETQLQLIAQVRRCGTDPSDSDGLDIASKRERLLLRIQEYHNLGESLFPNMSPSVSDLPSIAPGLPFCECDAEDCPHDPAEQKPMLLVKELPEHETIVMASTTQQHTPGWSNVVATEIELRKAQAFSSLEKIRVEVGHKSFLFRTNIRLASGKQTRLRGYTAVASANRVINLNRTIYHQARTALVRLKAPAQVLSTLRPLLPDHVKPLESVYKPNARNQRNKAPPWIWQLDVAGDTNNENYLAELHCVNWIRARSRMLRWKEEHNLVEREMGWVINYFEYQAGRTALWGEGLEQTPSQLAWAARRSAIWIQLKEHATKVFQEAREKLDKYIATTLPPVDLKLDDLQDEDPPESDGGYGSSGSDSRMSGGSSSDGFPRI